MADKKVQIDILADVSNFKKGMSDGEQATNKLHSALDRFGPVGSGFANLLGKLGFSSVGAAAGVAGAAVAIAGAAKIAEDAIHQYLDLGDAVRKYSQITGQSAEASTRQVFAFKELGMDADTVAAGMFKLARAADNAKDPLGAVGVEIAHNVDGTVDLNGTLLNVIKAWQGTTDAAKQAGIVFAAFGKAGAAMLPVLETNSAELKRLEDQVQLVYTAKDLEAIRKYKIAEDELKQSNDDLGLSIGRALLPAQTAVVEATNENIYVNEHLAQSQDYQTAVAHHNRIAADKVAESLRAQYRASLEARDAQAQLADTMKQAADAAKAEADAENTLYNAMNKNVDAAFAYQQSLIDLKDAQKAAADQKGKDAQANLRLEEAYYRVGVAAVAKAEAEAEANGASLSAYQKAQDQIAAYQALEKGLNKNSPLYKALEAYIAELRKIPADVNTVISVNSPAATAARRANVRGSGAIGGYAEGGTVPGPTGAPQLAVVHGGEEVIPVGGSKGGNHIHLHIGTLIGADGPGMDRLAREILKRARFAPGT